MKPLVRALVVVLGVSALAVAAVVSCGTGPSDATLTARFHAHRNEFEQLAAMAMADTELVGMGHHDVFVLDRPLQHRRLTEAEVRTTGRAGFRPLLERAGLPALSRARTGDAVRFVVVSSGGRRRGYVYSEKSMEPIVASLDGAPVYGYVALAPRWFLFSELSD
jgi:hypothetical protein